MCRLLTLKRKKEKERKNIKMQFKAVVCALFFAKSMAFVPSMSRQASATKLNMASEEPTMDDRRTFVTKVRFLGGGGIVQNVL